MTDPHFVPGALLSPTHSVVDKLEASFASASSLRGTAMEVGAATSSSTSAAAYKAQLAELREECMASLQQQKQEFQSLHTMMAQMVQDKEDALNSAYDQLAAFEALRLQQDEDDAHQLTDAAAAADAVSSTTTTTKTATASTVAVLQRRISHKMMTTTKSDLALRTFAKLLVFTLHKKIAKQREHDPAPSSVQQAEEEHTKSSARGNVADAAVGGASATTTTTTTATVDALRAELLQTHDRHRKHILAMQEEFADVLAGTKDTANYAIDDLEKELEMSQENETLMQARIESLEEELRAFRAQQRHEDRGGSAGSSTLGSPSIPTAASTERAAPSYGGPSSLRVAGTVDATPSPDGGSSHHRAHDGPDATPDDDRLAALMAREVAYLERIVHTASASSTTTATVTTTTAATAAARSAEQQSVATLHERLSALNRQLARLVESQTAKIAMQQALVDDLRQQLAAASSGDRSPGAFHAHDQQQQQQLEDELHQLRSELDGQAAAHSLEKLRLVAATNKTLQSFKKACTAELRATEIERGGGEARAIEAEAQLAPLAEAAYARLLEINAARVQPPRLSGAASRASTPRSSVSGGGADTAYLVQQLEEARRQLTELQQATTAAGPTNGMAQSTAMLLVERERTLLYRSSQDTQAQLHVETRTATRAAVDAAGAAWSAAPSALRTPPDADDLSFPATPVLSGGPFFSPSQLPTPPPPADAAARAQQVVTLATHLTASNLALKTARTDLDATRANAAAIQQQLASALERETLRAQQQQPPATTVASPTAVLSGDESTRRAHLALQQHADLLTIFHAACTATARLAHRSSRLLGTTHKTLRAMQTQQDTIQEAHTAKLLGLQQQLQQATNQQHTHAAAADDQTSTIAALRQDVSAKDAEIAALAQEARQLRDENDSLVERLDEFANTIATEKKAAEDAALKHAAESAKQQASAAQLAQQHAAEAGSLRDANAALMQRVGETAKTLQAEKAAAAAVAAQHAATEERLAQQQASVAQLTAERATLSAQAAQQAAAADDQTSTITALRQDVARLAAELEAERAADVLTRLDTMAVALAEQPAVPNHTHTHTHTHTSETVVMDRTSHTVQREEIARETVIERTVQVLRTLGVDVSAKDAEIAALKKKIDSMKRAAATIDSTMKHLTARRDSTSAVSASPQLESLRDSVSERYSKFMTTGGESGGSMARLRRQSMESVSLSTGGLEDGGTPNADFASSSESNSPFGGGLLREGTPLHGGGHLTPTGFSASRRRSSTLVAAAASASRDHSTASSSLLLPSSVVHGVDEKELLIAGLCSRLDRAEYERITSARLAAADSPVTSDVDGVASRQGTPVGAAVAPAALATPPSQAGEPSPPAASDASDGGGATAASDGLVVQVDVTAVESAAQVPIHCRTVRVVTSSRRPAKDIPRRSFLFTYDMPPGMQQCSKLDFAPMASLEIIPCGLCPAWTSLTDVNFTGVTVSSIGANFMSGCHRLTSLRLPQLERGGVVESRFLASCFGLRQLDLTPLRNAAAIDELFLFCCRGLVHVDLSMLGHLRRVAGGLLSGCTSVQSVTVAAADAALVLDAMEEAQRRKVKPLAAAAS